MPRLFYPPLVEPGVYVKPKGIQKNQAAAYMPLPVPYVHTFSRCDLSRGRRRVIHEILHGIGFLHHICL